MSGNLEFDNSLYREIFRNSAAAIAVLEQDFTISLANEAFCVLSGYTEVELTGRKWTDLMPVNETSRLKKYNQARSKSETGAPAEYETSYINKRGELRYCIISASVTAASKKTITTIIDITSIKEDENSLSAKEIKFRSIVEYANDIICSITTDGFFDYVSPNWKEKLGHSVHEVIGINVSEFIHEQDYPAFMQKIQQVAENGRKISSIEFRICNKHGNWVWYESSFSLALDGDDNSKMIIGVAHDISKRKKSESARIDAQNKLDMALKIAHLGPWVYDVEENLFHFNDTFYSLFKTDTKGAGSSTLSTEQYAEKFVHPEDRYLVMTEIQKALDTDKADYTAQIVHRMVYADGKPGSINVRISVEKDSAGNTIKIFGINQDITVFKKYEEEIISSREKLREMNALKDRFFSIIAHDLRNPVSSIVGICDMLALKTESEPKEDVGSIVKMVQQSSRQVMDLLSNLLDWAMTETGGISIEPENLILNNVIADVIELTRLSAVQKGIRIIYKAEQEIEVNTDLSMLKTILRNLISNAIKFSFADGTVFISAEKNETEITVCVSDKGIGMSRDAINELFNVERNHSTIGTGNEHGTGLGLVLCREFTEKLGGMLRVESTENKGSDFYFTIPVKSKYLEPISDK